MSPLIAFRSGVTRAPADFDGFAAAGVPIGITATGCLGTILDRAAAYANKGGQVFIDSGAFGGKVDFSKVFAAYWRVVDAVEPRHRGGVTVVAPDAVGDQSATLVLLHRFADQLLRLKEAGVRVIFALQHGPLPFDEVARQLTTQFGPGLVWGIPFNKAAWDPAQVVAFVEKVGPCRIHLFGSGDVPKVRRLRTWLKGHDVEMSCDSNRIKAMMVKGRRVQERIERRSRDAGRDLVDELPDTDRTEITGNIYNDIDPDELEALLTALPASPEQARAAAAEGRLGEYLEATVGEQVLDWAIWQLAIDRGTKKVRSSIRVEEIARSERPSAGPLFDTE